MLPVCLNLQHHSHQVSSPRISSVTPAVWSLHRQEVATIMCWGCPYQHSMGLCIKHLLTRHLTRYHPPPGRKYPPCMFPSPSFNAACLAITPLIHPQELERATSANTCVRFCQHLAAASMKCRQWLPPPSSPLLQKEGVWEVKMFQIRKGFLA